MDRILVAKHYITTIRGKSNSTASGISRTSMQFRVYKKNIRLNKIKHILTLF